MRNEQATNLRLAAAFALAVLLLAGGTLGVGNFGSAGVALADEGEPDFLVLNPEGE